MKVPTLAGFGLLVMASALPQAFAATYGDGMPSAQKVRFCERVRDFAVQVGLALTVFTLQIMRGLITLPGFTDIIQQLMWILQPALPALWNFIGLQAVGKVLLIFMDMEDNTRRAARAVRSDAGK